MILKIHSHSSWRQRSAFTFVEMLVAMALSAMFIGTAALVMAAIGANAREYANILEVDIGSGNKTNFYEQGGNTIKAPAAPNFGRLGYVQEMRDKFLDDMALSEAVFCLPRSGLNTIRPEWLEWPHSTAPETAPVLDTPEAFRQFLATAEPLSAGIFDQYRNVPSSGAPNISVFMLAPTDQDDYIRVQAVYDIDYVATTKPLGVYCSVRRYKGRQDEGPARTHYYDIFYEEGPGDPFSPTLVAFERQALLGVDEGKEIDRFKVAHGSPFHFLWWPDPSINPLKAEKVAAPTDTGDPLQAYGHMASKTGFFLTVPMFPSF